jgi:hypothetical protein
MLVWVEQSVRRFARYHKYTIGTQMRTQAMTVCRLVLRAQATTADERLAVVKDLHLAAEELKLLLQLGKEVHAFKSWAEFENGVELALAIARQAAGWRRALDKARLASGDQERGGAGVRRAEAGQLA